jgi:hypothetical protein
MLGVLTGASLDAPPLKVAAALPGALQSDAQVPLVPVLRVDACHPHCTLAIGMEVVPPAALHSRNVLNWSLTWAASRLASAVFGQSSLVML